MWRTETVRCFGWSKEIKEPQNDRERQGLDRNCDVRKASDSRFAYSCGQSTINHIMHHVCYLRNTKFLDEMRT
jgi:hypothetical protein